MSRAALECTVWHLLMVAGALWAGALLTRHQYTGYLAPQDADALVARAVSEYQCAGLMARLRGEARTSGDLFEACVRQMTSRENHGTG